MQRNSKSPRKSAYDAEIKSFIKNYYEDKNIDHLRGFINASGISLKDLPPEMIAETLEKGQFKLAKLFYDKRTRVRASDGKTISRLSKEERNTAILNNDIITKDKYNKRKSEERKQARKYSTEERKQARKYSTAFLLAQMIQKTFLPMPIASGTIVPDTITKQPPPFSPVTENSSEPVIPTVIRIEGRESISSPLKFEECNVLFMPHTHVSCEKNESIKLKPAETDLYENLTLDIAQFYQKLSEESDRAHSSTSNKRQRR